MKRVYPYLVDKFFESDTTELYKRNYLSTLDDFVNQKQYIKITLLNWNEEPIKEIAGEITGGNLSFSKDSSVRATGSLSCTVDGNVYNIDDLKMDYSINKKIYIELGIKNYTEQYLDYPILWFPKGVFFISGINISSSISSAVQININLKDKMALLDGTIGGMFTSTAVLDTTIIDDEGTSEKVLVYDLIMSLVSKYGGEQQGYVVIEDIPQYAKRVLKWNGSSTAYYYISDYDENNEPVYDFFTEDELGYLVSENDKKDIMENAIKYEVGEDIGYAYEPFVYNKELTVTAGQAITSALDTIKSWLGDYEYFYDEYGIFHFRKVKNYITNTLTSEVLSDTSQTNKLLGTNNDACYLTESNVGKSIYTFTDKTITSFSVTPQYENIKNDYSILGTRSSGDNGTSCPVWYHLVIDDKPEISKDGYTNVLLYREETTNNIVLAKPQIMDTLPSVGNAGLIYGVYDNSENNQDVESTLTTSDDKIDYLNSYQNLYDIDAELLELLNLFPAEFIEIFLNVYTKMETVDEQRRFISTEMDRINEAIDIQWTNNKYLNHVDSNYQLNDFINTFSSNSGQEIVNKYGEIVKHITTMLSVLAEIKKDVLDSNSLSVINRMVEIYAKEKTIYSSLSAIALGIDDNDQTFNVTYYKNVEKMTFYYWSSKENIYKEISAWICYYGDVSTGSHHNLTFTKDMFLNEITPSTNVSSEWYASFIQEQDALQVAIDEAEADYEEEPISEKYENLTKLKNQKQKYYLNDNMKAYVAKDWRTEIVLQGIEATFNGTDKNSPYFEELYANWGTIYDYDNQCFFAENEVSKNALIRGYYFFDIIDSHSGVYGEYCVDNIGRRQYVNSSDSVNCLFAPVIPNNVFIAPTDNLNELAKIQQQALSEGYTYNQINQATYDQMITGGSSYGAYDLVKSELTNHTKYQKQINITSIPVLYLDVNRRITTNESTTNTYGDYIISSIGLTFGAGGNMTIAATEVIEQRI